MVRSPQAPDRGSRHLSSLLTLVAFSTSALSFVGPSGADVSIVAGGAMGQSVTVSVFDGPPITSGPVPSVTLGPSGRSVNDAVPASSVRSSDAGAPFEGRLLETGALSVASQGSTGWGASTSFASAVDVHVLLRTLTATEVRSTCTSSAVETTGSTTLRGGSLARSDTGRVTLPVNPPPNTTFTGTDAASGNTFTVILNEHHLSERSITVTAVHVRVQGPSAVGDIVLGQSWCATRPGRPATRSGAVPASRNGPAPASQQGAVKKAAAKPPAGATVVSQAPVTEVRGSACGYFINLGLFGGPQLRQGCGQPAHVPATAASPSVTLPPEGSATPITATDPDGAAARYGPAVMGGIIPDEVLAPPPSGPMSASVEGTPAAGTVTSSAHITLHPEPIPVSCATNITPPPTGPCHAPGGFGGFPVQGEEVHVTCTATSTGVTGTTTFKNTQLATATGPDGVPAPEHIEAIPDNPPVNYTRSGVVTNVGDVFTAVYNEQIVNPDGTLTVNGVHMYLFGPTAVGEMVRGQATCGVTPSPLPTEDRTAPGCGRPVVAPMSPQDPTPKVPLTELIGVFDTRGVQSIDNIQVTNGTVATGNPDGLPYLQFVPGQTGPLAMTATRTDETRPMTWSFDARDAAGNVTHSSSCPTDSQPVGTGAGPGAGTGAGPGSGAAAGTDPAAGAASAAGTGTGSGAGPGAGNGRTGRFATTGANVLRLLLAGSALSAAGVIMVLTSRRRRRARPQGRGTVEGPDATA